jgi:hypothetical protein
MGLPPNIARLFIAGFQLVVLDVAFRPGAPGARS